MNEWKKERKIGEEQNKNFQIWFTQLSEGLTELWEYVLH